MRFEVQLTDQALSDIEAIGNRIAERAPETAARWIVRLREKIATLSYSAPAHAVLYTPEEAGREVRQTFFGVYRILYEVQNQTATVLAIRHGAKKPLGPPEVDDIE